MATKKTSDESKKAVDHQSQLKQLLILVSLIKNVRHVSGKPALEFLMVNQTFNMVPYRQSVYWEWDGEFVKVKTISGLIEIDQDGPYILWLQNIIKDLVVSKGKSSYLADENKSEYAGVHVITSNDCDEYGKAEWKEWLSKHVVLVVFKNSKGKIIGGLLMDREKEFNPLEIALIEDVGDSYAYSLEYFQKKSSDKSFSLGFGSIFKRSGKTMRYIWVFLILVLFIPVRMSATAPAEVVAYKPDVIAIPFNGTIEEILVRPGAFVKEGETLIRMDQTMLQNKSDMAESEMEIAQIALQKTEREAMTDRSKLAEIAILKSQLAQKSAEKEYADELLGKANITADRDGIAVFADPNSFRGKPVSAGEQIMVLADPEKSELLIRVPVDSMIEIDQSIPAKFFLSVMPLANHYAEYQSIGYQASPDGDGLLTYKIRARFMDSEQAPRIGWTGVGKVYGGWTILAANMLRRPLVAMRRKLGI